MLRNKLMYLADDNVGQYAMVVTTWQIVCITFTSVGEKWKPYNCFLLSEGMCRPSLKPTKDDILGILCYASVPVSTYNYMCSLLAT